MVSGLGVVSCRPMIYKPRPYRGYIGIVEKKMVSNPPPLRALMLGSLL